jgi:tetratricopeptide (TPR) repeat protein
MTTKALATRTKPVRKKPVVRRKTEPRVALDSDATGSVGVMEVATDWRFQLASLTRISDNLVSRAVYAYDRLFGLDDREEGEIYFEVAKKLALEDKVDDAIAALRKVLKTAPKHPHALYELGLLHLRRGAPLAAITTLQQAKAAGIAERKLHLLLADALCREERFAEALAELDVALEMKPETADTHYRRGLLLDRMERHADAAAAFEKAIRLAPREVRYHQSLGFTLETMGKRSDAIRCFKRALEVERTRQPHAADDQD